MPRYARPSAASSSNRHSCTQRYTSSGALPGGGGGANPPVSDVTIAKGAASIVSQFQNAYTQVQGEVVTSGNNATALARAKPLLQSTFHYMNRHIKGWGPFPEIWPDPTVACPVWNAGHGATADSRWDSFDTFITALKALTDANSGELILTFQQAPWWMTGHRTASNDSITGTKCQLLSDIGSSYSGKTTAQSFTRTDRHTADGKNYTFPSGYTNLNVDQYRVLDDQLDNWALHCYHCARRCMNLYGVRVFQVWNELKGYFHPSDGTTNSINMDKANTWDGGLSAGTVTGGPHAEHGYTYMYNKVYAKVLQAATDEGLSRGQWQIGGPYVSHEIDNGSGRNGGFTCTETGLSGEFVYGYHNDRTVQVLKYFYAHATSFDIVTLRASVYCKDTGTPRAFSTTDPFAQQALYADLVNYVRNTLGFTGPVDCAEWYSLQNPVSSDTQFHAAIGAVAHILWINAKGRAMLRWGYGVTTDNMSLLTPLSSSSGGVATPLLTALGKLNSFVAGTQLYTPTITDGTSPAHPRVYALISATHVYVVNASRAGLAVDLTAFSAGVINMSANEERLVAY